MKPLDKARILWKPFIAWIAIFVAVAACRSSNSAVPSPALNDVETVVAATMEAMHAQVTPTSIPPTPLPSAVASPTMALLPPSPVLPVATRLNFVAGATSGSIMGTIQPGQALYYVLNAAQGQPLIADLISTNGDVTLTIKTADVSPCVCAK